LSRLQSSSIDEFVARTRCISECGAVWRDGFNTSGAVPVCVVVKDSCIFQVGRKPQDGISSYDDVCVVGCKNWNISKGRDFRCAPSPVLSHASFGDHNDSISCKDYAAGGGECRACLRIQVWPSKRCASTGANDKPHHLFALRKGTYRPHTRRLVRTRCTVQGHYCKTCRE